MSPWSLLNVLAKICDSMIKVSNTRAVLLFSKLNIFYFGSFDPEKILLD